MSCVFVAFIDRPSSDLGCDNSLTVTGLDRRPVDGESSVLSLGRT